MTWVELVASMVASAGVSAALCVALGWLLRTWISERIRGSIRSEYDQKLEAHKAGLQQELETHKIALQTDARVAAFARETEFAHLHRKRAEVIAELYALLKKFRGAMVAALLSRSMENIDAQGDIKAATEAYHSFTACFDPNSIFLPLKTEQRIEELSRVLTGLLVPIVHPGRQQAGNVDPQEAFCGALDVMAEKATPIFQELETEFRRLLGDDPQSSTSGS
jgi:hypothetical protein